MNNKIDQEKFKDIYFEGKPMEEHIDGQTFNVCYLREYMDPEHEGEFFSAYETVYRNVPRKFKHIFTALQQPQRPQYDRKIPKNDPKIP